MKRALVVATVGRFFDFEKNDIRLMKELGYEVHGATNMNLEEDDTLENFDIVKHQIDFARSPFSKQTIIAYKQLKKLLKTSNFDLIHCHTPVGGILTRLAARKYRKNGTKVIYTAHGFHFFKGAPRKNWIIFYPLEKIFSRLTDVLITINKEDYERANKGFYAKRVEYIPGVGIDVEKFNSQNYDRTSKRNELGISDNDFVLLSVGELIQRKNHETVLKALAELPSEKKVNIKYLIVGKGDLDEHLKNMCKELGLTNVKFLGFRRDIPDICASADLFVFPSFQEGLPVALMEAMAAGLPVVCSNIRGNVDLINNGEGGFLYQCDDYIGFSIGINNLMDKDNVSEMSKINLKTIQNFDASIIQEKMSKIYNNI